MVVGEHRERVRQGCVRRGLKPTASVGSALKRTEERVTLWRMFQRTWAASGGLKPAVPARDGAPAAHPPLATRHLPPQQAARPR